MPNLAKRLFFRARLVLVDVVKRTYFKLIQPAVPEIVQRNTAFRIRALRDHGSHLNSVFSGQILTYPTRVALKEYIQYCKREFPPGPVRDDGKNYRISRMRLRVFHDCGIQDEDSIT